jgi:hypothetical protein
MTKTTQEIVQETQEQVLHLLLKDKNCTDKWMQSNRPTHLFDVKYHLLLKRIEAEYENKNLLTRKSYMASIKSHVHSRPDRIFQEILFNDIWGMFVNSNDYDMLLDQLADQYNLRQFSQINREYIDKLKKAGPAERATLLQEYGNKISQVASISPADQIDEGTSKALVAFLTQPIDLRELYDQSPPLIQNLTQLFYTRNPLLSPALHFFVSIGLVGGMIGKRLVADSMGRKYYPALWFVGLATTGKNKSFIKVVKEWIEVIALETQNCPYATMEDKFTMSYAYSEIGETVPIKEWQKLDEEAQMLKKRDLLTKFKSKRGRIIISDELGQKFKDLIESGTKNGELGTILQLADTAQSISGSTAKDGFRIAADLCVSILGLSQPDIWRRKYDCYENLESGLIGRFFIADEKDYRLDLQPLDMQTEQVDQQIKTLLSSLVARCLQTPKLAATFHSCHKDVCAESYNELMAEQGYQRYDSDSIGWLDNLRSKIIVTAIKMTLVDRFLTLTDQQITDLQQKKPEDYFALGKTDCDFTVSTDILVDKPTFKRYCKLLIESMIKLFHADPPKSEAEITMDRIRSLLIKASHHQMTLRDICRRNLPYSQGFNHRTLTTKEAQALLEDMAEQGHVKIHLQGKSTLITLTGKGLRKEAIPSKVTVERSVETLSKPVETVE